jgi:predicted transcriptional regulator
MKIKKIDIGIKTLEENLNDFSNTWKKLQSGEKVKKEEGIYFDSIDSMRSILTNNRLLILKTISEYHPKSVYELAKLLKRDLKNVNQDLNLLSEIGLVVLEKHKTDKERVVPYVGYDKILLEIPVN